MSESESAIPRWPAAVSGVAAAAVTVGVASLVAGILTRMGALNGLSSPLAAVASAFIDLTPSWLKDAAIAAFGTNDKVALGVGMVLVIAALSTLIGVVGAPTRWGGRNLRPVAYALIGVLGAVAGVAVLTRPSTGVADLIPTVIGALLGAEALRRLWYRTPGFPEEDPDRRRVLTTAGVVTLGSALAALGGNALGAARANVDQAKARIAGLLKPPVTPAGAQADGATPFITPNADFYRIDTAFVVPVVDPDTWKLRIVGMVEREVEYSLADLITRPTTEAMVTLQCVSNEVGGSLAGNAVWTGWPVRELLAEAGVKPGADMVLSKSTDGFTASTPLTALTDDRNSLLAIGMNGEPLPVDHGFPARLVVPGLYGYVSATKWVTELKVTRFEDDVAYWTTRGWSDRGPVKTSSRIDVPVAGITYNPGKLVIAGTAWANHRGVIAVEVSIDEGPWQPANLAAEPTVDAWRQWWFAWEATSGRHTLRVRATDAEKNVQDATIRRPDPDGATGLHSVQVTIR